MHRVVILDQTKKSWEPGSICIVPTELDRLVRILFVCFFCNESTLNRPISAINFRSEETSPICATQPPVKVQAALSKISDMIPLFCLRSQKILKVQASSLTRSYNLSGFIFVLFSFCLAGGCKQIANYAFFLQRCNVGCRQNMSMSVGNVASLQP